jgi:hypothetical protein
VLLDVPVLKVE